MTVFRWRMESIQVGAVALLVGFTIPAGTHAGGLHRGTSQSVHVASPKARCRVRNKPAGTLRYSDWTFPDSLNPYQTSSAVSSATINFLQDTLVYWDQRARIRPQLLNALPTLRNGGISRNGKTIVLNLKHGVRWSNGAELTARDVQFSWQIARDAATGICPAINCDLFQQMRVRGKYSIVIRLKRPYAGAVDSALAFPLMPHVWSGVWHDDPHVAALRLEDPSYNFEGPDYPTNGAYQVTEFVNNDRIVLKPMRYYNDMSCGGFFKTVIFAFYSSTPALIAAAASGQTDLTGLGSGYTAADLPELKRHARAYRLDEVTGFSYDVLELNHDATYGGHPNPLASAPIRVALALALDKLGLIESALGVNATEARKMAAWTPWVSTPGLAMEFADRAITGQWDPITRSYVQPGTAQALEDARKLRSTTPYKRGFSLDFVTTAGDPVRQAQEAVIAQNWNKIGVKLNPRYVQIAQFFADWQHGGILVHGDFQVAMHGFATNPEPDGNKTLFLSRFIDRKQQVHSVANQNYSGIVDPQLDRDFTAAGRSWRASVRRRHYYAIQNTINKRAHWIMLYFRPVIITYNPKLHPVYNNPTFCGVTCNAWALKMND